MEGTGVSTFVLTSDLCVGGRVSRSRPEGQNGRNRFGKWGEDLVSAQSFNPRMKIQRETRLQSLKSIKQLQVM